LKKGTIFVVDIVKAAVFHLDYSGFHLQIFLKRSARMHAPQQLLSSAQRITKNVDFFHDGDFHPQGVETSGKV
jgi:hypothetical protein